MQNSHLNNVQNSIFSSKHKFRSHRSFAELEYKIQKRFAKRCWTDDGLSHKWKREYNTMFICIQRCINMHKIWLIVTIYYKAFFTLNRPKWVIWTRIQFEKGYKLYWPVENRQHVFINLSNFFLNRGRNDVSTWMIKCHKVYRFDYLFCILWVTAMKNL